MSKKKKLIVFDADSIVFTVAWNYRTKKIGNMVKMSTNKFISDVLKHTNADDYLGFYAAKDEEDDTNIKPNFRYAIDPNYKGNRPPTPEFVKKWRPTIHGEFRDKWSFMPVEGLEADDAVAIAVEKYRDQYDEIIVASFDKDLKTIPNITYYYLKEHTMVAIDDLQATYNFCKQMLMGDSGDNIPGIKGIGKAGADKILAGLKSKYSLFKAVVKSYKAVVSKIESTELQVIKKEIESQLNDPDLNTSNSPFKGLKGVKLDRQIRIFSKQRLADKINEVMPGGWKKYFRQQYSLLKMLTVENENLSVAPPLPNPVKQDLSESAENAAKAAFGVEIDDFLTF